MKFFRGLLLVLATIFIIGCPQATIDSPASGTGVSGGNGTDTPSIVPPPSQ